MTTAVAGVAGCCCTEQGPPCNACQTVIHPPTALVASGTMLLTDQWNTFTFQPGGIVPCGTSVPLSTGAMQRVQQTLCKWSVFYGVDVPEGVAPRIKVVTANIFAQGIFQDADFWIMIQQAVVVANPPVGELTLTVNIQGVIYKAGQATVQANLLGTWGFITPYTAFRDAVCSPVPPLPFGSYSGSTTNLCGTFQPAVIITGSVA